MAKIPSSKPAPKKAAPPLAEPKAAPKTTSRTADEILGNQTAPPTKAVRHEHPIIVEARAKLAAAKSEARSHILRAKIGKLTEKVDKLNEQIEKLEEEAASL